MDPFRFRLVALLLVTAATAAGCQPEQRVVNTPAPSAQEPRPRNATFIVPAGTTVVASLQTPLSTERNAAGDEFVAMTTDRIVIDGKAIVPTGAQLRGVVRDVQASRRIKGQARMTLVFQGIVDSQGTPHGIVAEPLVLRTPGDAGGGAGTVVMPPTGGVGIELGAGQRLHVLFTEPTRITLVALR